MARFDDLNECHYVRVKGCKLIAVGWLDSEGPQPYVFPKWTPSAEFLQRLTALGQRPQPSLPVYAGWHTCNIESCKESRGPFSPERCGSGELYVPHVTDHGTVYCAPRLIIHYVAFHKYQPPVEFVEAVMRFKPEDVPILEPDGDAYAPRGCGPDISRQS